jgi:hypothetical protein
VTGRKIPVSVEKVPVGTKNGNFQKKVGRSKIVTRPKFPSVLKNFPSLITNAREQFLSVLKKFPSMIKTSRQ